MYARMLSNASVVRRRIILQGSGVRFLLLMRPADDRQAKDKGYTENVLDKYNKGLDSMLAMLLHLNV